MLWRSRLQTLLDRWCRWLGGALKPIAGTEYYSLTAQEGSTPVDYDAIAGDQFAAAAAGHWLAWTKPQPDIAERLRGLIDLALDSHVVVRPSHLPPRRLWGATVSTGDNWHAALFPAATALLAWPALDTRQREKLTTILQWEADYHTTLPVGMTGVFWGHDRKTPGRMPTHSNGESLAWTATLLQAARWRCPESPHREAWRQAAISHSLNALSLPGDLTCPRLVAGQPLDHWVKGANFEPGGIQEHHGFYHPGYMAWPLASQAAACLIDDLLAPSQRDPDVYLHNWPHVFSRLKNGCLANGRLIYAAGFDWNQYGYGNSRLLSAALFAAGRLADPDAARLVDQYLTLMEHQQNRGDGSIQGERLATARNTRPTFYAWYESIDGQTLAECLWILERLGEERLAQPASEADFNRRQVCTYHEPNARLAWHRTPTIWASIAWRAPFHTCQMLVQPLSLPHLLKANAPTPGHLEAQDAKADEKLQHFRLHTPPEGGFWSLGKIHRLLAAEGPSLWPLVHQYLALIALPDGQVIFIDRCRAEQNLILTRDLSLGMRLAADIFNEQQVRLRADGLIHVFKQHPQQDTWHDLRTRTLTIEERMTLTALGAGSFQLLQKRRRCPDGKRMLYDQDVLAAEESLLAHELYFGTEQAETTKASVAAGQWFRSVAILMRCHDESREPRERWRIEGCGLEAVMQSETDGWQVLINFADQPTTIEVSGQALAVDRRTVEVRRLS